MEFPNPLQVEFGHGELIMTVARPIDEESRVLILSPADEPMPVGTMLPKHPEGTVLEPEEGEVYLWFKDKAAALNFRESIDDLIEDFDGP